ncbi:hypothetical protein [Cyanobium gracile]|nr:hypothetical protein [Cyanobium gracile]
MAHIRVDDGLLVIKDKVPFRVFRDCSYDECSNLDICDSSGSVIGMLLGTRSLGPVNVRALTEWQLAAYLLEREYVEFDQPIPFAFDYVVIDSSRVNDYQRKMKDSSEIWGSYSHVNTNSRSSAIRQCQSITAIQGMRLPTPFHKVALERAVQASHPFERYLKYYHELELLFDWIVVKKIQALQNDLQGAAKLISSYQSGDLPRLKDLILTYCNDAPKVHSLLANILDYRITGAKIFQDYGKEGNPLKDSWSDMCTDLGKGYFLNPPTKGMPKNQDKYDKIILESAAYWIFRIRCCIAHHRIGEYLLSQNDDEFVIEFGERLLLGTIGIILENPDLHGMME